MPWDVGTPRLKFPPAVRNNHWREIILHPCGPSVYNLFAKVLQAMNCQEVNLSAWQAGAARARCQGVQSRDFCGFGVRGGSCWAVQFSNACSGTFCRVKFGETWSSWKR